jgi:hypothetical protein
MKLTTHLQLVLRLRTCGATSPLPIHLHGVVLMKWIQLMVRYLVKHRGNFTFYLYTHALGVIQTCDPCIVRLTYRHAGTN